jgi:hypothetical protein
MNLRTPIWRLGRTLLISLLPILLFLSASCGGVNVTGKWTGQIKSTHSTEPVMFILTQTGAPP